MFLIAPGYKPGDNAFQNFSFCLRAYLWKVLIAPGFSQGLLKLTTSALAISEVAKAIISSIQYPGLKAGAIMEYTLKWSRAWRNPIQNDDANFCYFWANQHHGRKTEETNQWQKAKT